MIDYLNKETVTPYHNFIFYLAGNNNVQNMLQLFGQFSPGRVPFGSYFYTDIYQISEPENNKYSRSNFGVRIGYRVLSNITMEYPSCSDIEDDDKYVECYEKVDLTRKATEEFANATSLEESLKHFTVAKSSYTPLKYISFPTWTTSEGHQIQDARFITVDSLADFVWTMADWYTNCNIVNQVPALQEQLTAANAKLEETQAQLEATKSSLDSEKKAHSSTSSDKKTFTATTIVFAVLAVIELVVIIVLIILFVCCRSSSSSSDENQMNQFEPAPNDDKAEGDPAASDPTIASA